MQRSKRTGRWDAIVVGSGAAGAMAAYVLTCGGADVLMLEAGPELPLSLCGTRDRSNADFQAMRSRQPVQSRALLYSRRNCHLFVDDIDNPYTTEPPGAFRWIRSRQAGGRTLVWSRFALRLSREDLQGWPVSYEELAPFYTVSEKVLGVRGTLEGLASVPDGEFLPVVVPPPVIELRRRLHKRWPERPLIPAREAVGHELAAAGGFPAHSSLGSSLARSDRSKLTFQCNCVATRVILDRPDHAGGVLYMDRQKGGWHEAAGRVVVLCASTIESTRLLLASRNKDHPDGLGNSSGGLGRYLLDHLGGPRVVAAGRVDAGYEGPPERIYIPRFQDGHGERGGIACGFGIQGELQVNATGSAVLTLGVFGEALPRIRNSVRLDDNVLDADGIPVPNIRFAYDDEELRMGRDSAHALREIVDALGFRIMVEHDSVLPPGTRSHELGGAAMGADSGTSILDPFNRCWDVRNLFVTDGACFPRAGDKGPTLTIMALTARACAHILQELRAGRL